jgi:hypothetical protein
MHGFVSQSPHPRRKHLGILLRALLLTSCFFFIPAKGSDIAHITESNRLTEEAQKYLARHNFKSAMKLIRLAVKIDPDNEKAKTVYVHLREIYREDPEPRLNAKVPRKTKTVSPPATVAAAAEAPLIIRQTAPAEEESGSGTALKQDPVPESQGIYHIQTGIEYLRISSNYLKYMNTDIDLAGCRFEGGYSIQKAGANIGLSGDFSCSPLKIKGNSRIDVIPVKAGMYASAEKSFFDVGNGSFSPGFRAGYMTQYIKNKKSGGALYFKQIFGPSAGLFVSDPLFSRFSSFKIFSGFGVDAGVDIMFASVTGKVVLAGEYNAHLTYRFGKTMILGGYRAFVISGEGIRETYKGIELAVRVYF